MRHLKGYCEGEQDVPIGMTKIANAFLPYNWLLAKGDTPLDTPDLNFVLSKNMNNETTQYSRDSLDEIVEMLSNWLSDSTHFETTFDCYPLPDRDSFIEGDRDRYLQVCDEMQKLTASLKANSKALYRLLETMRDNAKSLKAHDDYLESGDFICK